VKNRRYKAGETLTETLIAMLIIGLSSVLFLTMVGTSGRIFRKSETAYKDMYDDIAAADLQEAPFLVADSNSIGTITVKGSSSTPVEVNWYGKKDYVLSYKVR